MNEEIKGLVKALAPSNNKPGVPFLQGVITAVSGNTVSVTVGGSTTSATSVPYLTSYYPAVGDVVWLVPMAGDLLVIGSTTRKEYKTYTPTWSGTGFVLGSGVSTGRYTLDGDSLTVVAQLVLNGTTMPTSGALFFSLPSGMSVAAMQRVGQANLTKNASNDYLGKCTASVGATAISVVTNLGANQSASLITATSPFTWATNDVVLANLTLEIV